MWPTKPGSATLPFFGVQPVLLTEKGEEIEGAAEGILAIKGAWPSMFRDLYNNHERYEETYFSPFKVGACRHDALDLQTATCAQIWDGDHCELCTQPTNIKPLHCNVCASLCCVGCGTFHDGNPIPHLVWSFGANTNGILWQGYYFCGDGARRDKDGYIWITGRVDDVLNVSGHRVGTAEVENALTQHPLCAEAAVIGCGPYVTYELMPSQCRK